MTPPLLPADRIMLREALCDTPDFLTPRERRSFIRTQLDGYPMSDVIFRTLHGVDWSGGNAVVAGDVVRFLEGQEPAPGIPALALIAQAIEPLAGLAHREKIRELRRRMGWSLIAIPPQPPLPDTAADEIKVELCMAAIPTALVHLFDASTRPLIRFVVRNNGPTAKSVRFVSYVDGYSAQAVETLQIAASASGTITQLPTLFPKTITDVTELTKATVNATVEDIEAGTKIQRTFPLWLLARTSAPLAVVDPSTGQQIDMTPYLAAFVTPNAPAVQAFLTAVAAKHPQQRLVGDQVGSAGVAAQVQAVFEALKESGTKYINSVIEFTPVNGSINQRVRLPRESLSNTSANCIDGTVLVASLLEAISLHPAIVVVPGHAFVGWETYRNSGEFRYLETTMIATHRFDEACASAEKLARKWEDEETYEPGRFRRMPLRELRKKGITPLE